MQFLTVYLFTILCVPLRWTDYTAVGKRIPGTRFITFKVPLKQSFRYQLTQSQVFGPFDLVHMLEKEGQELGLIIDLTFTTRYYKPQDLPDTLHHLKIFTAGHEVPNNATILSFKKAVRRFLRENENNDKLIGVHCTHGLNRTGYLICRYLIDVDGMEPRKAIELFNASRGHSIERQNYIDDLRRGPKRSPFHQKNNTKRFGPPDQVPYHSPMGMRPPHPSQSQLRPPRPSQSFGSTAPCPSQLHADMFGKPCRLPTPEGSKEPQGPHRKHRKNRKKGWKNKTSYGNRGDSQ
ncbi:RNA/RNP complex-1-interacting phosphatase isoform X3 [Myxocyprinus asiaticus]|uniref:RNA/RNP complex-1-interacting phosphatase isoform X3 n=1 Tax=Myxocyprinus asiaticus TaxID=70543 RepID=UPI002223C392|nr:RNA/RNP complex-1-interacting phosphatase isoform X3 [Myxocyprinus asiaticus]